MTSLPCKSKNSCFSFRVFAHPLCHPRESTSFITDHEGIKKCFICCYPLDLTIWKTTLTFSRISIVASTTCRKAKLMPCQIYACTGKPKDVWSKKIDQADLPPVLPSMKGEAPPSYRSIKNVVLRLIYPTGQ